MNSLHRNDILPLLLLILLGCGMSAVSSATLKDNQEAMFDLWTYFDEAILWQSDWTRFFPNATVKEHFRAYRDLTPNPDPTKNFSSLHTNTFFYEDGRGEVSNNKGNCVGICGPFELDKEDSRTTTSSYGLIYAPGGPFDFMRTIVFPDRSLAWIPQDLPTAEQSPRAGMELFLGDGEFLRVSIGIFYDTSTGQLDMVSVIREDARGFGPFWSNTDGDPTEAPELTKYSTTPEKQSALDDFWFSGFLDYGTYQTSHVSVPGLEQSTTFEPGSLWLDQGMPLDTLLPWDGISVFEVLEDGIMIVCPNQLPTPDKDFFEVAVAWKKADGTWAAALEAVYKDGTMSQVEYITMTDGEKPTKKTKKTKHSKKQKGKKG